MSYIEELDSFDIDNLPNLDTVVFGALELFAGNTLPEVNVDDLEHPLVVGSGNAEATGRIIFQNTNAVFASESTFEEALKNIPSIDSVVLVSASGAKHAPIIAKVAKKYYKNVVLITNTAGSEAEGEMYLDRGDRVYVFPKNREPYTYNTSTYMGMILGKTGESAEAIQQFIETSVATIEMPDFNAIDKYYLIVPPQFSGIMRMLNVKFIELFGRTVSREVETAEYVRHATTVVPSDELFISFGEENTTWGSPDKRLHIPLPENADYGAMMAIGYYVVGQIQKQRPALFKENIAAYTAMISEVFQSDISPIVEK